jgi:hypothetical protein
VGILQADLDAIRVLECSEVLGNFAVVVGVVEDVGGRKSVQITDVAQSLHDDFKQTSIIWLSLVELLVEGLFALRGGTPYKNNYPN